MFRMPAVSSPESRRLAATLALFAWMVMSPVVPALAQQTQDTQKPAEQQKPRETAPAEAGGPQGDIGPIAVPRREEEPPPPPEPERQAPEGMPDFSLRVDVPTVNVDVAVRTDKGIFVPGLQKQYFQVLEDGVPQQITSFEQESEAPITAVLLVEFANNNYYFMIDALRASYSFASMLRPEDWIAVVSFDMRTRILNDFTQDKRQVYASLDRLRIPGFSETALWDALYDTLDRLEGVEGKKYIILVTTGRNTFSRLNYDDALKKVRDSHDITIFSVATGEAFLQWVDARYGQLTDVRMQMLDFMQGKNALNTFAKMTGGQFWAPRFSAQFPEIFQEIGAAIRNRYRLSYKPTNKKLDGSYRKIEVKLLGPDGQPLTIRDQDGDKLKYKVYAREGYTAGQKVD